MILLDILKVKKKNHPGNQNAVGKEYIRNTGLVFRLGGAIVSSFFFKLWQKQQNFPKEQSSSQLRFLGLYLLDNLKIKQNATKYILNLICLRPVCRLLNWRSSLVPRPTFQVLLKVSSYQVTEEVGTFFQFTKDNLLSVSNGLEVVLHTAAIL